MNDKNATHTTGMSDAAKESRRAYYKALRMRKQRSNQKEEKAT